MPSPIKIRAQMKGDVAEIRVQLMHPMETGQRKNTHDGMILAAHFVQTFSVAVNGKIVVDGQTGPGIARNPVFLIKLRGAQAGDPVTVSWRDNKGEARADSAVIG